jgi:glycosyltransferase involved in cell wall biosynthesis
MTAPVALLRLLCRDGFVFFLKCVHYAASRDAWLWLLRGGRLAPFPALKSAAVPDLPPEERERSSRILRNYRPTVSVVVTSYNYAHIIRETLDALVAQTYPAHEILVVDNGSKDDSVSIIREYEAKWPSVRLLQHEGGMNKGLPASVKLGAETATGEFVAFCEADDLWTPDHLEKKVEFLRERWGEPNVVINDIEPFGDPKRCSDMEECFARQRVVVDGVRNRISPILFREHNWILTFSICMVRRSTLLSCDILSVPFPSNLDVWLWRQICFDNDVWVVREKLTKWRLHGDSYLMRECVGDSMADVLELRSRMDLFLFQRHPALADSLLPFLRLEDRARCGGGRLLVNGMETEQPGFSVVMAETDRAKLDDATICSVAEQTYGHFELIVVSAHGGGQARNGERRDWMSDERISGKLRFVPAPEGSDTAAALEAGIAAASADWVVPVLSGDRLRPDALKTFAARIVLGPDINGVFGLTRTMVGERYFGGKAESAPGALPGPFACVGAFAFRRAGAHSATSEAPPISNVEARLAARMLASPPVAFTSHIIVYRDDSPASWDPGAKNLLAAKNECLRSLTFARKPIFVRP